MIIYNIIVMSNIDKLKSLSIFLKHDANEDYDYKLIRTGKRVLNIPQNQLYNTKHHNIVEYFLTPNNSYSSNPFGSSFYIDFDLPKLNSTFHEILLRFKLTNLTGANAITIFPLLFIDRVKVY